MDAQKIKTGLEKSRNSALKKLADLRKEIDQIDDEIHWLENAPLPLEDAISKIDSFIKNHSNDNGIDQFFYQKSLSALGVFETQLKLNRQNTKIISDSEHIAVDGKVNIADILIPLFSATLQRSLHDMAKKQAGYIESGPPLAERPELEADLQKRKYGLEVIEEELICQAEELSMDGFYRRPDCNPNIVLMMEV